MIVATAEPVSGKDARRLAQEADSATFAGDMTLRLIVREVAEREGITNPYELSKRARLPYETCRALWNENSNMIALKTLERLCTILKVRPSQLIEYEPEVLPPVEETKAKAKRSKSRKA